MARTRPAPNLMAELLDLPVVSAGLRTAQSQGVHWGRQLLEQHSELGRDGMVEHAIRRAMWRTAGTGACLLYTSPSPRDA